MYIEFLCIFIYIRNNFCLLKKILIIYNLVFYFLFISFYSILIGKRLNEYISHYETLSYDEKDVHASHNRAKRSITKDPHVYLKFNAYGKRFHIRLKRDLNTFSDNLVVSFNSIYNYFIILAKVDFYLYIYFNFYSG